MLWTRAEEQKLLITIIESAKAKPSWELVSEKMGENFSDQACRQKYAKLRNAFEGKTTPLKVDNPASKETSPSTARGRKRQRSPSTEESPTPEPTRRRKLFPGPHKVGKATSELKFASPKIRVPKTPGMALSFENALAASSSKDEDDVRGPKTPGMALDPENALAGGNLKGDDDAGAKGDDEG
ncbi:hypothetical protein MMC07_000903 [Pseudocyphellaria aurata]|nr:hypothetical protein [Pseudocyphellaria aurata]